MDMYNTTPYVANSTADTKTAQVCREDQENLDVAKRFFEAGGYLFDVGSGVSDAIKGEEERKKEAEIESKQDSERTGGK